MLRVLLVRHGVTHDNVAGITQGHTPGALTPLGRAQAAALASRLARTRFHTVYCSDLGRCVETLQIATAASALLATQREDAQQPEPQFLSVLRERGAGEFEGTPLGTVDSAAAAAGLSTRAFRPVGGESWHDVLVRASAFLQLLATNIPPARDDVPRSVLAVTHGGFIRAAAERSPPGPKAAVEHSAERAGNTAVYTFDLKRAHSGSWHCALVAANDTEHLAHLEAAPEHETE